MTTGVGVVFKLDSTGNFTVLHNFAGGADDGSQPNLDLIRDPAGNLYGTTDRGGAFGLGVVYRLDTAGKIAILHSFGGAVDRGSPTGGLFRDFAGNLYGSTFNGGASDNGMVFKLDPTGQMTILHSFAGAPADGSGSRGFLIRDFAGNFYGTTNNGGASNNGTVFKLDPSGKETVLYSFAGGPADGSHPGIGLVRDLAGNLYGATPYGGASNNGTVFKLDPTGRETVCTTSRDSQATGAAPRAI
jgi:uncharacterized repeat protein (TIGR03803 family)